MIRYIFLAILGIFGVLAFYYASRTLYFERYKDRLYVAFSATAIASGLWSIGYAAMQVEVRDYVFWVFRDIGVIGLFAFLIAAQIMICTVAKYSSKVYAYIDIESIMGIILLAYILDMDRFNLEHTERGILTAFKSNGLSVAYFAYIVVVALSFVAFSIDMVRPKYSGRVRAFGKKLLVVEFLILIGMVFDTLLPMIGVNFNVPASTMLQFIGLIIVYQAVHDVERNRLNMKNMTGYIYNSMKSPILIFDKYNKLGIVNSEAEKMFDLQPTSNLEKVDFWHDYFEIEAPDENAICSGGLVIDGNYQKKELVCQLHISEILDDYGDYIGYIVAVSDMTDNMNYARELEQLNQEAVYANEAKSQFLANMSHGIRTPMNAIIGFSGLALREDINDTSREYMQDIHDSAEVLLSVINDILNITKIESGKLELVNQDYSPSNMIKDVSRVIGMQASRKGLGFELEVSPELPKRLYGDKLKLRGILINLLNNGIKYTNEGYVKLRVNFERKMYDKGMLTFEIVDTGIGIKEEELERVFDAFQRVDLSLNSSIEGTGLGLAICRGYVELMGGDISVASSYGYGTTFTFTVEQKISNVTLVKNKEELMVEESSKMLFLRDVKILAVDDVSVNLKLIERIINRYGAQLELAKSGKEAIDKCKEDLYDLVLMDQMMPEIDGIEAMKTIREYGNGYELGGTRKIVVFTANAIDGVKENLLADGFDDYISKPVSTSRLEKILIRMLPEEKYYFVSK